MNDKDRFLGVFLYKEVDRIPDYEFCFWTETIDRWHTEGLPLKVRDNKDVKIHFGFDVCERSPGFLPVEKLPVRTGLWPTLPSRILEEKDGRAIVDDGMGGVYIRTVGSSSPPHFLHHPLKNRGDWDKLRPFFDPNTPGRFPLNWDEMAESFKERDYPLGIIVGGLYGWLRNWMGVKQISIALYRDPDWIEEMMDTLIELWIETIRRALRSVRVDCALWWEDMCYNRGSLLSVRHFEEFMVPRYKKVSNILREYGVKINLLDCDGNITQLVPGWLKSGINCMLPLEARYNNLYELREKFGNELLLMGGVNKFALMRGGKVIDKELKRLTPLLKQGGYIPMVDHCVPPEVSLADYNHYLKCKRRWIGKD